MQDLGLVSSGKMSVLVGKNCVLCLEYGRDLRAQFFPIRTSRAVNNVHIFFNPKMLKGQLEDLSSAIQETGKNPEQMTQNSEEQARV